MTGLWVALAVVAVVAVAYWALMAPHSQVLGRVAYRGDTAEKVVALTFDDGPNEPYTSRLLDGLAQRGIRATFFLVGRCVERHPEVAARIVADGHVVGNHSLTHRFHTYLVPSRLEHEVRDTQEILTARIGRTPALYRSPWLWRHPLLLRMLRRHSLRPVAGDFCHPLEVFQPAAARIARGAVGKTRPGSILIFHDGWDGRGGNRAETVAAVELAIDRLIADGYRFVTVDELLGVPAYQPV